MIAVAGGFYSCETSDILNDATTLGYCIATRASGDMQREGFFRYVNDERVYFTVSANKFIVKIDENMEGSAGESAFRNDVSLPVSEISAIGGEFKLIRVDDNHRSSKSQLTAELVSNDAISFVGYVIVDEFGRKTSALTNQVTVRLRNNNDFPILLEAIAPYDIVEVRQDDFDSRIYLLTVNCFSGKSALQIANELHRTGLFEFATPDLLLFIRYATNDTHFSRQWGLKNPAWGSVGIDIRAQQAWTITTGSPNVRIAILDTGVDLHHPDLRDNLLPGFNAVTGATGAGAGAPAAAGTEYRAHGTAVAGVAAARANNGIGIAGVAHTSQILPISMRNEARASHIAGGINWARLNGARVINMSFGMDSTPDVVSALNAATAANIVLVASSGNDYRALVNFPASRQDVIAVGAICNDGFRGGFSNHGTNLDVVAPGVNIWTTGMLGDPEVYEGRIENNGVAGIYFSDMRGTSLAAPHVAGVAALMLSVNPNLRAHEVRDIIKRTANRSVLRGVTFSATPPVGRPAPWNRYVGHGLVDAFAAVVGATPISGPNAVCPGVTNAVFSIPALPNTTVEWVVDAPLAIVGDNNLRTVRVEHRGAAAPSTSRVRAKISLNEKLVHTVVREVVVNRPTIQSIQVPSNITIGSGSLLFTANHNAPTGTTYSWSVFPAHGVVMNNVQSRTANIGFTFAGGYTITVAVTNACGTHTMSKVVSVTGTPSFPIVTCHFCGTPSNMPPGCPRCLYTAPPCLLRNPDDPIEVEVEV